MKGILIILDGVGDLPHRILKGKTPLESAKTPNLNFFASNGDLGQMWPVRKNFAPSSEQGILSIFGNSPFFSRGQLEAAGVGLNLENGGLALRVNFGTIDNLKSGKIIDRRAGRTLTTKEAENLAGALSRIKLSSGKKVLFKAAVQHRGVLALKGDFSDAFLGNDLTYSKGKITKQKKISEFRPLDNTDEAIRSANILNEFAAKSFEVLNAHEINKQRRKKGLLPANYLFMRSPGSEIPRLKQHKKWISFSCMPLETGFSKLSGMETRNFKYPELKSGSILGVYKTLWAGLKKSCAFTIKNLNSGKLFEGFDYAYVHIKETDLPGHDGNPAEKKKMIEYLDRTLFKFLKKFSEIKKFKILVTGDHSTPCELKRHSDDPVPVLLYGPGLKTNGKKRFCEKDAAAGSLGKIFGNELLDIAGFNE